MIEIKITGQCSACGFYHDNTITSFYRKSGSRTRYAQCAKCKNIVPFKIQGCTCKEVNNKIVIGDCKIHNFLSEKARQQS